MILHYLKKKHKLKEVIQKKAILEWINEKHSLSHKSSTEMVFDEVLQCALTVGYFPSL